MDRVRLSWTLGALSVGIIVALVALPSTNWLLKNVADSLRYGRAGEQMALYPATPKNLTDFRLIENDADAKFMADRDLKDIYTDGGQQAIRYAEAHPNDPEIWAETLSSLYAAPMHKRPGPSNPSDSRYWTYNRNQWPKYDKVRLSALRVAEHGHELEPNNGFFAFALADIAWGSGDRTTAARALEAAAKCTDFKDYHFAEGEKRLKILDRHFGYRGEDSRFGAFTVQDHDYEGSREFAQEIATLPHDKAGLLLRLWSLRTASLIAERGSTVVSMFRGYSSDEIILLDGKKRPKDVDNSDKLAALLIAKAGKLESELTTAGIHLGHPTPTEMVSRVATLAKAIHAHFTKDFEVFRVAMTPSFSPEGILLGVILAAAIVFAVMGVGAIFSLLPRGAASALLPYACAIGGCISVATEHGDFIAPLLITFAVVRCLPGVRKHGHWCNLATLVSLLSLNLTFGVDKQNLIVAALFGLAWPATTFDFDSRIILVISGFVLALVVVPILRAIMVLSDGNSFDYAPVTFGCVVLVAIFPFKRMKAVNAMPSLAFAVSLLVLVYVANGVILNNKLRPAFNRWANTTYNIRSEAGPGPRA